MQQETFDGLIYIKKLIPEINCGGCAILMLALYKHLEDTNQSIGDEKFVYLYDKYDSFSYKNNVEYLNNNNKGKVASCSHAVLFHNGCYYNAGGIYYNDYPLYIDIPINNMQFIIDSILSYTWNLKFDRIKNIPIIEYVFGVNLNEIRRDNYYEP